MGISPERWREAGQRFDALVDADATERAVALAELRLEDPELADLVQRLLDEDASDTGMLDRGLNSVAPTVVASLGDASQDDDCRPTGLPSIEGIEIGLRLGQGGMGEVFRAERCVDGVHQTVALKLLRPGVDPSGELRRRFQRERRILARLEHPDIARFVDAGATADGQPWLAMEFVDGEPITDHARRSGLDLRQRVALLLRVARAVAFAQTCMVVHRDIKPSNILVDANGRPRLLDFGIAKLLEAPPGSMLETQTVLRAFSPAYAAPEQIHDEPISMATDVYALGLVLYELLTGRLPRERQAGSVLELSRRLQQESTERPSTVIRSETSAAEYTTTDHRDLQRQAKTVAGDLDLITLTALKADPTRRYASAEAFANDLENWLEGRPIAARPDSLGYRLRRRIARNRLGVAAAILGVVILSAALGSAFWQAQRAAQAVASAQTATYSPQRIVVLPFSDFSPDGDQAFLGEGIADTLTRRFAEIEQLSVIARTSASAYRGRDVASIAKDLRVGWVLEGSVQRGEDRLRIIARLVRTSDQSQVWSLSVERAAGDIFAVQDEIAAQVLEALLGSEVLGVQGSQSARTRPEVYDLYLQGRERWQRREGQAAVEAVTLLEQAVAMDPGFAPARSELATALYLSPSPRLEKLPQVEAEIREALTLDPDDAQAHAIRGLVLLDEGRLVESRDALRKALERRPNDVNILAWLASSYSTAGLMNSAARYNQRAYELDSMNVFARTRLIGQLLVDRPAEAIALARQTVRLFPESSLAWGWLVGAHERQGNYEAAVLAAVDALEHVEQHDFFVYSIASGFNNLGELELADRWRARIPDYRTSIGQEYQWLTARGRGEATVALAEQEMAQHGELPWLLVWYGRALVSVGRNDEAWLVLNRVMAEGPSLDEPGNVNWAQSEIPILVAGLARRRGDTARAEALEAALAPLIEQVERDWPLGAEERRFFLDIAMGRYERAASRLRGLGPRMEPVFAHMVEHIDWWRPLGETEAGRAFIENMRQDLARQLQRLRESDIPWLLEPEAWSAPSPATP